MSTIVAPSILLGPTLAGATPRAHEGAGARVEHKRAALVGTSDPHVSSLLTDVLRDIHLDVEVSGESTAPPDVVLAMVDRAEGVRAISEARARFPRAPVVAILTLGTHRLGTRAVSAGASACYLLDMPIDRLRGLITALLKAPVDDKSARKAR